MSSFAGLPHANSGEIIRKISEDDIPNLLKRLFEAQNSIPQLRPDTNATTNNDGSSSENSTIGGGSSSENSTIGGGGSSKNSTIDGDSSSSKNKKQNENKSINNNGRSSSEKNTIGCCCGGGSSKDKKNSEIKSINNNNNNNSSNGNISNNGTNGNIGNNSSNSKRPVKQLEKLQRNLRYVAEAFNKLNELQAHVRDPINTIQNCVATIIREVERDPESLSQADLDQTKLGELNQIVSKLKNHVAAARKISSTSFDDNQYTRSNPSTTLNGYSEWNLFDELPSPHMNELVRHGLAVEDIRTRRDSLDDTSKRCLLCFAAFPENEVLKKTLLMDWWIGGCLVTRDGEKTAENVAEEVFEKLAREGFIEPVNRKRRLTIQSANSFKMHPSIRSEVIELAQEAEFFDSERTPNANFLSRSGKSEGSSSQQVSVHSPHLDPGKLETLFNISERYLGFEPDWFSKMKKVEVLYLGRWQSSADHHIEVEDTEFLKGLRYFQNLKFFSLQGISRITELPDSICKLSNLRILDLRACHNLELLPSGIGSLKKLMYLDMSECYLLDQMPKGLTSLSELKVLKGFVIGPPNRRSPCTLNDLASLKKLRKLSINTGWEAFPTDNELIAFQDFKDLRKLTITWSLEAKSDNSAKQENETGTPNPNNKGDKKKQGTGALEPVPVPVPAGTMKPGRSLSLKNAFSFKPGKGQDPVIKALPPALEKLDLQCYPHRLTPEWLRPDNLMSLKKLYIRGGKLHRLGEVQEGRIRWKVEILRLKYLCELNMDWSELLVLFPELIYLEKVKCPKLIFFPCDESGVWLKQNNETEAEAGHPNIISLNVSPPN